MKRVNESATPSLARLGNGDWWALSHIEKEAIATWATMFTMTVEHADRITMASTTDERAYLMNNALPPDNWKVWIASCELSQHRETWFHSAMKLFTKGANDGSAEPNTQVTTVAFGKLLLHTFSTRADINFEVAEYGVRLGLQPIWPIDSSVIKRPAWPFTDNDFIVVANALELMLRGSGYVTPP